MLFGWEHLTREEQDRIAAGIATNRVLGGPYHLEIHPTNRCNVNCFFCFCKHCHDNASLPWEMLQKLLTDAARRDLRFLRISGGGESLLYPQIQSLLDLCGRLGLRIADLTTNGTRLASVARQLVEVGTDFVLVSLNEVDPARHARMMEVHENMFRQAVKGIEALCRERDGAPPGRRPKIALQLMLWKENHPHLRQLYDFGVALGVDQIVIKRMTGAADEVDIPDEALERTRATLTEIIQEDCADGACRLRFDLSPQPELNLFALQEQARYLPPGVSVGPEFKDHRPRIHYCYMGWFSTLVSATGLVYPCCPLYGVPGKEVGNIHETPLEAIWEGERYGRFREEFRRLMLVRGDLEHSRRFHQFLEPICINCYGCLFGFHLAGDEFYERIAGEAEARSPLWRRAAEQGRNVLVRATHRVRRGLRR